MFDDDSPTSMNIIIDVPLKHKKKINELRLPSTIKVRLVKIILSTGEAEVLATSLLSMQFPQQGEPKLSLQMLSFKSSTAEILITRRQFADEGEHADRGHRIHLPGRSARAREERPKLGESSPCRNTRYLLLNYESNNAKGNGLLRFSHEAETWNLSSSRNSPLSLSSL